MRVSLVSEKEVFIAVFRGRGNRPPFKREPLHRTNERIRIPAVRVVGEDGEAYGVMDTRDAVQKAREMGLDLVEIAPNAQPPVCRIIDYGKFLYEEKKKTHEAKKKQVKVEVKELKFRPGTDDHDYEYRVKRAKEWLIGGDKVRAAIAFRGREMTHRELGSKILARMRAELADVCEVEVFPKMEGYQMFMILSPKKVQKPEKNPVKKTAKPIEKASTKPVEKPVEKIADKPVEVVIEKIADKPVEVVIEKPAEKTEEI